MPRPKKAKTEKRTHRRMVNLSDEELKTVEKKANKANMTIPEYLRTSAIKTTIKEPDKDYSNLAFQLAKIGSNLNQITKRVHESRKFKKEDKSFFNSLYRKFEELKKNVEK